MIQVLYTKAALKIKCKEGCVLGCNRYKKDWSSHQKLYREPHEVPSGCTKSATNSKQKQNIFKNRELKDPNQPPSFSMPSKSLILYGEAKSQFFTIGCVPESMFNYVSYVVSL